MGTRNLTMVVADGKLRIAQYGQFDGYPEGQGVTALRFCKKRLTTSRGRRRFREQLSLCRLLSNVEESSSLPKDARAWVYNREIAAGILEYVWKFRGYKILLSAHKFKPLPQSNVNKRKRGTSPSIPWPVCQRCGLVLLRNEVSQRAGQRKCEGQDDES